jgi:hypothetical protein
LEGKEVSKLACALAQHQFFVSTGRYVRRPIDLKVVDFESTAINHSYSADPVYRLETRFRSDHVIKGPVPDCIIKAHFHARRAMVCNVLGDISDAIQQVHALVASGNLSDMEVADELLRLVDYLFDEHTTEFKVKSRSKDGAAG